MAVEVMATQERTWLRDGVLVLAALAIAAAMLFGFYSFGPIAGGCAPPVAGVTIGQTPSGV